MERALTYTRLLKKALAWTLGLAIGTVYLSGSALASEFTLTVLDKELPEEIVGEVRDEIAPKAYQLSDADGVFYEFWFVKEVKIDGPVKDAKEALEKLDEVSLLGAMVVHREGRIDFREDEIDVGVYVLRLAMQPQDGDHMGTAPYDSFAILIPADRDEEVIEFPDHESMVEISGEDTVVGHPPILSLQPSENGEGDFPRLDVGEEDWQLLSLRMPVKAGKENSSIVVHLVFEGIGFL